MNTDKGHRIHGAWDKASMLHAMFTGISRSIEEYPEAFDIGDSFFEGAAFVVESLVYDIRAIAETVPDYYPELEQYDTKVLQGEIETRQRIEKEAPATQQQTE